MPDEESKDRVPLAVVIASTVAGLLAIIHLWVPGVVIDNIGLALLLLAIMPWLIPYLQRSIKQIEILGNRIEFLQTEVSKQQRIINDLVIFSISSSLFEVLSNIHHKREYKYHDDEGSKRNLRFLRNHGYVHYFRFDDLQNEQDLATSLRLTPAGELLVRERERREKQ